MIWQSIKTAPKDGTKFIGFQDDAGEGWAYTVWWGEGGWDDGEYRPGGRPSPTHWQPMPLTQELPT